MTNVIKRGAVPLVILILVATMAIVVFGGDDSGKRLTAYFPRTISLYEGSDVRVLGVAVGTIDSVVPEGTRVKVEMTYDEDVEIPVDATAVIVSPSIVGDRYVQLTPAYTGGEALDDNVELPLSRTEIPLELDQIYSSLDRLTVALGPNGANAEGALTDLLQVTASNFAGQGKNFNLTIRNFSQLTATLDDNKEELFGATRELQQFITTLAENDTTVRRFNDSLGDVSSLLADEREDLAATLDALATGLDEVGSFVRQNRDILGKNIRGLNRVLDVVVRQRGNLDEVLRTAPLALNNLVLAYNPDAGTLDTNANVNQLEGMIESSPKDFLCSLVSANDPDGEACDLIQTLPLPRTSPFGPGKGAAADDIFDLSLGGFVEVDQ